MAGETITRSQLSEAVYQEVGLSRNESADLLEAVLNKISETLARGETVKISSFGSFSVRNKGQRVGRNPKTGEEVPILPRRVLVFRPSQVLKSRISEPSPGAGSPGSNAHGSNANGSNSSSSKP
jgi:integration host factor subunit alpha